MFRIPRVIKAVNLFRTSVNYAGNFPRLSNPLRRLNEGVLYSFSNGQSKGNPEERKELDKAKLTEAPQNLDNKDVKNQQVTNQTGKDHILALSQNLLSLKVYLKNFWTYMIRACLFVSFFSGLYIIHKYQQQDQRRIEQKAQQDQRRIEQKAQKQAQKKAQEQAYFDKYMIGAWEKRMIKDPFRNYQCYTQIQKEIDRFIQSKRQKKVLIIEGPPGIGKTTAVRNIISEKMKDKSRKQKDNRQLQIFYINFKINKDSQLSAKQIEDKVKQLQLLLSHLYRRHADNKQKNIVLVIDEINNMCREQYSRLIKEWRESLYLLKIIGLSSCSEATQFWINCNGDSFNRQMTLQLNRTSQILGFLKEKLASYKIPDETLKLISSKYSTFRVLSEDMQTFLQQNDPNSKNFANLTAEEFNSTLINYFNPKITKKQVQNLHKLMKTIYYKKQYNFRNDKKEQDSVYLILKLIALNQMFRFLGDEYKMAKGRNNPFEVSNIKQMQRLFKTQISMFEYFQSFIEDLMSCLSLQNYIFMLSIEKTCPKSQEKRQIIIGWINSQLQQLENDIVINKKHKNPKNIAEIIVNTKADLVTKIKRNKKILEEEIGEWKVEFELV